MARQLDEEAVVELARRINSPQARADYLQQVCAGDSKLAARVKRALEGHDGETESQEVPPGGIDVTADMTSVAEQAGSVLGNYKLLQQIGEGGFGVVFMAEQTRPVRRKVALKIIKPGMDTREVIARFEAERQALALMDHPNIARVLDAGATESGRPYFVMELVKGVPLTEFCDSNKSSAKDRLDLFVTICRAVQHAHQKGIIHRDLKPSNVMVTLHDNKPVPKVIDFGVSKAISQQLTEKTLFTAYGQMVGTPVYMSPEQAQMSGLDIDTRSDIYSLGVILYELLTGTTPLDAHRLRKTAYAELQRLIREEDAPTPSTRLSTLGDALPQIAQKRKTDPRRLRQLLRGDLDWIVMKALEKERSRRYESASALAADVQRFLAEEPIEARPPSAWYRFSKLAHRNKVALATASLVGLSLIAGTLVSTRQAVRATTAEAAAKQNYENEQAAHRATTLAEEQSKEERDRAVAAKQEADFQRQEAEEAKEENRRQLYLADMNLAQQAYDAGHLDRMNELLLEYWPLPGDTESDLRGFEWYYLWQAGHLHRDRLRPHGAPIRRLVGSADGKLLIHSQDNENLFLRDATNGRLIRELGGQGEACFSHDDSRIAIGAASGEITILTATDGKTLTTIRSNQPAGSRWLTLDDHARSGLAVAFSPDDKYLASGDNRGKVIVWNIEQNIGIRPNIPFRELPARGSRVRSLAYTQDGTLFVGLEDGSVVLWDVESSEILAARDTHKQSVSCVRSSPLGLLASGSYDGTVQLWTGQLESVAELSALGPVNALAFSPDGEYLAAGTSRTNSVVVWTTSSSPPARVHTIRAHSKQVHGLAFGKRSRTLWSASGDLSLKYWNLSRCEPFQTLGSVETGSKVTYAADGRVIFLDDKGSIQAWDAVTRSAHELLDVDRAYSRFAVSANGNVVAGAARDGKLDVWDLKAGRLLSNRSVVGDVDEIALTSAGRAVSWSDRHGITVLDVTTEQETHFPMIEFVSNTGAYGDRHIISSRGHLLV